MKTARELDIPARKWVPDRLSVATVFLIMLPIAMLNGTYTGSMVEVSNTLGVYTEDITIGYYAASAGMAIAYPIVPKILGALSANRCSSSTLHSSSFSAGSVPVRPTSNC